MSEQLPTSPQPNKLVSSKIVVGIPCYNEEKTIAKIILQLKGVADQVLVCDDGSSDMTADIALALGARVISHGRNMGKGAALRSLFLEARETDADVFVTIDGDGQHDLLDIPKLASPILKGECDIVVGSRFSDPKDSSEMPKSRKFGSKILNSLISQSTGTSTIDTQSGFRAYSMNAVAKITPGEQGMGVDTEILGLAKSQGMKLMEVPTTIRYKNLETSKQNALSHFLDVIASTLKFTSLRHPLQFYGVPALVLFVISIIAAADTLVFYSSTGHLPFGPTILATTTFIMSMILGAVAIMLFSLTTLMREER
jgi:glycosyltransferase involved in cell wall biosynthesis